MQNNRNLYAHSRVPLVPSFFKSVFLTDQATYTGPNTQLLNIMKKTSRQLYARWPECSIDQRDLHAYCTSKCSFCAMRATDDVILEWTLSEDCEDDIRSFAKGVLFQSTNPLAFNDVLEGPDELRKLESCPLAYHTIPAIWDLSQEVPSALPRFNHLVASEPDSWIEFCKYLELKLAEVAPVEKQSGRILGFDVNHNFDLGFDAAAIQKVFTDALAPVVEGLKPAVAGIKPAVDSLGTAFQSYKGPKVTMRGTFGMDSNTQAFLYKTASACFCLYAFTKGEMPLVAVSLAVAGYVFAKEQVLELVRYMTKKEEIEKQGVFDSFSIQQCLGAFVLGDIVKSIDPGSGSLISSFVSKGVFFSRKVSGLTDIIDYFLSLVQKGLDSVSLQLTGEVCPFNLVTDEMASAYQLIRSFVEVESHRASGTIAVDESINIYEEKLVEFEKLYKACAKNSAISSMLRPHIANLTRSLTELKTYRNATSGFRVEPVGLFLVGAPGIGKSMLAGIFGQWFALELASPWMLEEYSRNPDSLGSSIYSLNQAEQYSSGYRGQPIVFIDEAHPDPMADGVVSLPVRLLSLINAAPCPLTMADLGSKGNTFFTSKVVMATSNHRAWTNLKNVDAGAFYRRAVFVSVAVKEEFSVDPSIQADKRSLNDAGKALMTDFTQRYTLDNITMDEFINGCYSVLEFKIIDMKATGGQMHHAQGTFIEPCALLKMIFDRFEGNKDLHNITTRLTGSNVVNQVKKRREQAARFNLRESLGEIPGGFVEKQGGFLSKPAPDDEDLMDNLADTGCLLECDNSKHCSSMVNVGSFREWLAYRFPHGRVAEISDEDIESAMRAWDGKSSLCCCRIAGLLEGDKPLTHGDVVVLVGGWLSARQARLTALAARDAKKEGSGVIKTLAFVASMAVALKLAAYVYKSMFSAPLVIEGDYPFRGKNTKGKKAKVSTATGAEAAPVNPEVGVIKPTSDLARSVSKSNQYNFVVRSPNSSKQPATGNLFVLYNRIVMMPRHLLDEWCNFMLADDDSDITFLGCCVEKRGELSYKKFEMKLDNIMIFDDELKTFGPRGGAHTVGRSFKHPDDDGTVLYPDMVVFSLPLTGKNRMDHFVRRADIRDNVLPVGDTGVLTVVDPDASLTVHHGRCGVEGSWEEICSSPRESVPDLDPGETAEVDYDDLMADNREWFSSHLINYRIRTANGNCGSPFFTTVNGVEKIVSLHVAGRSGTGFAWGAIVYKEDIEAALKAFYKNNKDLAVHAPRDTIDQQGSFAKMARAKPAEGMSFGHPVLCTVRAPAMPVRTKLVHSPIFAALREYSPGMAPALLVPTKVNGEMVYPMEMAQKGYGSRSCFPSRVSMDVVVDSVFATLMETIKPNEMELRTNVSTVEAICPGPAWEHLRSMPRKTSAGFPYCLEYKGGKTEVFGTGEQYEFSGDKSFALFAEVSRLEDLMVEGKRPLLACMSFLKDERRPFDRVLSGKTRLISATNMAFTIICRKYTMGFVHFLTRGKIDNGLAVGCNPYSGDWDHIAAKHGYRSDSCSHAATCAGDYSGFDKLLSVYIIERFGDLLDMHYGTKDVRAAKLRRAIITELCMSRHVVGETLVQWCGSNPSGNFLTALLNSCSNMMMSRHSQLMLHMKFNKIPKTLSNLNSCCFELFNGPRKLIETTNYGDDMLTSLLALLRADLAWFGHENLANQLMEDFGITYTDETKGKRGFADVRRLGECAFLKRGFELNGSSFQTRGKWFAPLELSTIVESIRWTKEHDKDRKFWIGNVRDMLEELSLHNRSIYETYGAIIVSSLRDTDYFTEVLDGGRLPSQEMLRERVLQREYTL